MTTPKFANSLYKKQIREIAHGVTTRLASNYADIPTAIAVGDGTVVVDTDTAITSKITVPAGVHLKINAGVSISSTSDIDMIEIEQDGILTGGRIVNTHASFSKACLKLDSSNGNFDFKGNQTLVSDVLLEGPSNEPASGVGLHLHSSGVTASAVQACTFRNIAYRNLNIAIYQEVIGGGNTNYINGNVFEGITIDDCTRGIVQVESGTGNIGNRRNLYTNILIQAGTSMEDAINVVSFGNYFSGAIFDWQVASGTYAVVSSNISLTPNEFQLTGPITDYYNISNKDIVRTSTSVPTRIGITGSATLPDATLWESGIVFLNDINRNTLAYSTGKVWSTPGGVIFNSPTSTELLTTHVKTLTQDECGLGVGWTSSGANAAFTFNLPSAGSGLEIIIANSDQITTLVPNGTQKFSDQCGSGASDAMLGTSSSQNLQLPAGTSFVHLKSYIGEWCIVASRGVLSYV